MSDLQDVSFIVPISLTLKELEDLAGFMGLRDGLIDQLKANGLKATVTKDPLAAVGRKVLEACGAMGMSN